VIYIDFETRSKVDLKKSGTWVYSQHPSTEVLCMAFAKDNSDVRIWKPTDQINPASLQALFENQLIEAHNVFFERAIWENIMVPKYGWPEIKPEQWRCSAALAAYHAIPRSLENAGNALGLATVKDQSGKRVMMQLAKPRAKSGLFYDPTEDAGKFETLYEYCKQDVQAERAISEALGELPASELKIWQLDQKINHRGVPIDRDLVSTAIKMLDDYAEKLTAEAIELTEGELKTIGQRAKVLAWCADQGEIIKDYTKAGVAEALKTVKNPKVKRLLEIRQALGKTSTAKYESMLQSSTKEGRIRDTLMYHGAATGRWCLTGDHEVLTENGWVRFDQWTGGRIAVWSQHENISFTEAKAVQFDYSGDMYSMESQRISQLSTPDHKMPTWNCHSGKFEVREVKTLNRTVIPYTGRLQTTLAQNDLALRILVMIQADGHYTEDGGIRLGFKKSRKIERCKRLLRQAEIFFSVDNFPSDDRTNIMIKRRHMPLFLIMFSSKTFGWWLLDCNADAFFDELQYWDAHISAPNSFQYTTCNKQNADVIQTLAHLSFRAASMLIKDKAKENPNWNTAYVVNVWNTPPNRHEFRSKKEITQFEGKVYCAETTTGFFLVRRNGKVWVTGNSGKKVQFQNLPRGSIKDMDTAVEVIRNGDRELIEMLYGNFMPFMSSAIRGMVKASEGNLLVVADFAAIEARVLGWLAGSELMLQQFRDGVDLYKEMASKIYKVSVAEVTADQRQLGKAAILGAGYGMGHAKFLDTCLSWGIKIDEDLARLAITTYRETYPEVPAFWKEMDRHSIRSTINKDNSVFWIAEDVFLTWKLEGRFLKCELPSKRSLHYYKPEITDKETPWGMRPALTFMGEKQGKTGGKSWMRVDTYGGKLVENITQAVARDLMAEAMLRIEAAGFEIIMSVHDELVAEVPAYKADLKKFENLMAQVPSWAKGCPIEATGWVGKHYKK